MNFDLAAVAKSRAVILVEGMSDQAALEALAGRRGRPLGAQGISIVPMGGATSIGPFVDMLGPHGLDVRLAGLCDAAEEGYFRRALEGAGLGSALSRADMEALGFYVCTADLEDELVRALGVASVEQIIAAQGDIRSFPSSRSSPPSSGRAPRGSSTGSWGPGPAGRASTRACSWARLISPGFPGRLTAYSLTYDEAAAMLPLGCRRAGAAYQFRHIDLQHRLAARCKEPSVQRWQKP